MEYATLIICLALIICLFLVWFFTHRANHRERLLRIEKGLEIVEPAKENKRVSFFWLRLACLVIGLSIGVLTIITLIQLKLPIANNNALPLGVLGFCGGVSMLVAHYLQIDKAARK